MTRNIMKAATRNLRKLRQMSAREIRCRCGEVARRSVERRQWSQKRRKSRTAPIANGDVFRNAVRLVPGSARGELDLLRRTEPEFYERLTRRAFATSRAIRSGSWQMLGHEFDLRGPIDWHRDPRSAFRWPRVFYGDLPLYELPGGADVKYAWELGRQQYVAELARAWLLTGDHRSAELARSLLLDWIDANPLYEGIHWTSGLEVAMRAISWIWTIAALAEWDGWLPGDGDRIASSLAEHAIYLEHHFSFYSSPYNHVVGEATALLLIALVLDGERDAARWKRRATVVLSEYGPRQFHDDGFCVEQATGYHFYTLGFLSLAIAAARQFGDPPLELETVVRQAYVAGLAFRRPDGRWPAIGDVDSARSIPVHHDDFWLFDSLCQLGAVLFEEPLLKRDAIDAGEETYWLQGAEGVRRWHSLETTASSPRVVLRDSGYVIAGDERDWLLFDAGPIADGLHADATPSVAHGHADVFQVLYVKDGSEILLDAGMPFYGGGRNDWVEHFRSAAAHNTFDVEGTGPVRPAGSLAWSHCEAEPTFGAHLTESSWLAFGRAEWDDGAVKVERHVLVLPGLGLWTADLIETDRPRTVRWHWNSRQPFAIDSMDGFESSSTPAGNIPFAVRSVGEPVRVEVVDSNGTSPAARVCIGYGKCTAANAVRVVARVERRILVATRVGTALPFEVRCGGFALATWSVDAVNRQETTVYSNDGVCWKIVTGSKIDGDEPCDVLKRFEMTQMQSCSGGTT